jgi:hypothetical protein
MGSVTHAQFASWCPAFGAIYEVSGGMGGVSEDGNEISIDSVATSGDGSEDSIDSNEVSIHSDGISGDIYKYSGEIFYGSA